MPDDVSPIDDRDPEAAVGWRARLDDIRARWTIAQLAATALLCVGVLVAGIAVLKPAAPRPRTEDSLPMATRDRSSGASGASSASSGSATSSSAPAQLVVHAAGAVAAPGLYRLPPGSRVADLIAAAGGMRPDADADRVNLAAPLHDGERVAVPRMGEVASGAVGGAGSSETAVAEPLDLNTATVAQLDALPGVGPATAQAIVDDRERNGPFRSVDDLLRVRGIGPAKLDQLRPLVTV